ncbi:MAG: hypothetical protein EBU17_05575 [Burkholderiaceae bacterium]|nr:hypothetical protein [Burkholderiaceae bacterium]
MPSTVSSYHYLVDQRFADAVGRFLERERMGIGRSHGLELGKNNENALK